MNEFEQLVRNVLSTNACSEAKAAAQTYLDTVGTDSEADMLSVMVDEFKADIIPVDAMVEFCATDEAKEKLGEETASRFLAHAKELKASGASFCDCPACSACIAVIEVAEK